MLNRAIRSLIVLAICIISLGVFTSGAYANDKSAQTIKVVNVNVGGYLDVHNESLILSTLRTAQNQGVTLYVIQLDSNGIAGADISNIATTLKNASIVTAIWVGPNTAKYSNDLDPLLKSVDFVGASTQVLAKKANTDIVAPSMREFYAQIDGRHVKRLNFTIDTGCSLQEITDNSSACDGIKINKTQKFVLNIAPTFEKLSVLSNLAHSLIKPSFAIGIFVLGLTLIILEFYAASVGISSVVGIAGVLGGFYGFGYLPVHWFAIIVVVLGVFAMTIDIQNMTRSFYSYVGAVLLFVGSLFVTPRGGPFAVSIIGAIVITIIALVMCLGAIPSVIRTRFGTVFIDRDRFIGQEVIAIGEVKSAGTVSFADATWPAKSKDEELILSGQKCLISSVDEIVFEVEPVE